MSNIPETYMFSELCHTLGKSSLYVHNLQRNLQLPIHKSVSATKQTDSSKKGNASPQGYSLEYLCFLEKIVAMRAFNIPLTRIVELFEIEKKILVLLHIDALCDSEPWYLGVSEPEHYTDRHLLLTGHDVGFTISDGAIQHNLDFGDKEAELFDGKEMGEDVRRVLHKYIQLLDETRNTVHKEQPILRNALDWAEMIWGIR